jgi:hypothetical protein
MKAAPAISSPWFSMTRRSRLKPLLQPLLQKGGFCRRGFSPELSVLDGARVAMKAAPAISSPWFSVTRRSRLKPLLQKWASGGGAFAPNLRLRWRKGCDEGCSGNLEPMVLDDAEVAAKAAPTTKMRSRLKPLLQKDGFCRRGFSPELSVLDGARVAMKAAPAISSPWFSMTRRSRLKPLLQPK